jgi:pyridoxal phosphate enzyme (YggS family)
MVDRDRLLALRSELKPYGATLVAVSKTRPAADVAEAFSLGQADFGENYVQELLAKRAGAPEAARWHFIGHLQSNKAKFIAPFVSLVQSVDSLKLLRALDKEGRKAGRAVPCLLQVHIAEEETKFGFAPAEAEALAQAGEWKTLPHAGVCGLMGMASFSDDAGLVRNEFRSLKSLFDRLAPAFNEGRSDKPFAVLSMGMTSDYRIALDEGSNMVRIGTALFGARG